MLKKLRESAGQPNLPPVPPSAAQTVPPPPPPPYPATAPPAAPAAQYPVSAPPAAPAAQYPVSTNAVSSSSSSRFGQATLPPAPAGAPAGGLQDKQQRLLKRIEEMLKVLSAYDIVILVDDSTSMRDDGAVPGVSRWSETVETVSMLLEFATQYDDDGVNVFFINRQEELTVERGQDISAKLSAILPTGGTAIGARMQRIFDAFVQSIEYSRRTGARVKPMNLIVITDGAATDQPVLVNAIVNICKRLAGLGYQKVSDIIGIQFYQVGNDRQSTAFIQSLDDDLSSKYGIPDIVDSVVYDPSNRLPLKYTILKTLLGGIDGDIDNGSLISMFT